MPVHEAGTGPPVVAIQTMHPPHDRSCANGTLGRMAQTEIDPLALDRQLCFALAATSRSVIALYRDLLEPMGLTHPQYLVMLALWEHDPRSVREIAGELRLESATLSPLLKRLEASGYLRRTRSTADERQLEVSLTTAGRALRDRAREVPLAVAERLGWPLARLEALKDELTELLTLVDGI